MICWTICRTASTVCARLVSLAILALMPLSALAAEPLNVYAAASLTNALDRALAVCAEETGVQGRGIYSGSGTAARQIAQGAPAALYISANPQWMDWLEQRGMVVAGTRLDLLGNGLVMIENGQLGAAEPGGGEDDPFAIADPESVPAGRYAKQAMERTGLWPLSSGRIVFAGNVREVLAWVARGEARYGIVYASDALSEDRVKVVRQFGGAEHDPVRYPAALVGDGDSPEARSLLACLKGEEAYDVFGRYGFTRVSG